MPAYSTISVEFDKRGSDRLVQEFYAAFLGDGVTFDRVFPWGCEPDLTYEQIIGWNQDKLNADFRLGYNQNVSHNFRQILITVRPFSECRLYLMNMDTSVEFHCIVPEDEINTENCLPLLLACLRVWSQLPVLAIESYGEIDSNAGHVAIKSGRLPSASLFAIVDNKCKEE